MVTDVSDVVVMAAIRWSTLTSLEIAELVAIAVGGGCHRCIL